MCKVYGKEDVSKLTALEQELLPAAKAARRHNQELAISRQQTLEKVKSGKFQTIVID